jgi:hypothetical protein
MPQQPVPPEVNVNVAAPNIHVEAPDIQIPEPNIVVELIEPAAVQPVVTEPELIADTCGMDLLLELKKVKLIDDAPYRKEGMFKDYAQELYKRERFYHQKIEELWEETMRCKESINRG